MSLTFLDIDKKEDMAVIKAGFRCGCLAPLNKTKFDEESRLKE